MIRLYRKKNVYQWYKDFKEGRERVQDKQRLGRASTSTDETHVKKIKDLLFRDLADAAGISIGSAQTILKRVDIYETMISDYQNVMKRIITKDETWIYAYGSETTD